MSIPTIIFIVPYRNRIEHKHVFSIYMKHILEEIDDYEIYFSHQCDNRPFNRGCVKNMGFLAMKAKYPQHYQNITFIFNDVDTMPYKKDLLNYETTLGTIKHFYGFPYALGGIFSIKGADFERVNGFPNYWGYGLEDNCMQMRVLKNRLVIDRSNFYPILDPHIIQLFDGVKKIVAEKGMNDFKGDNGKCGLNNISNFVYQIDDNMINIRNFTTLRAYNDDNFIVKTSQNFKKKHLPRGKDFSLGALIKR